MAEQEQQPENAASDSKVLFPDVDFPCPPTAGITCAGWRSALPGVRPGVPLEHVTMAHLADPSESVAGSVGNPIFDFDIPCPQCEYNLRGLVEPRCPECGHAFDPHAVLMAHRDNQPPLPILWVVRNMYRHPLAFWQMQEVRRSRGPKRLQIFFGLIYVPVVIMMICAAMMFALLWAQRLSPLELVMISVSSLWQALYASVGLYVLCLVHGLLCRLGLVMSRQREGVRAAKEIVGYGLVSGACAGCCYGVDPNCSIAVCSWQQPVAQAIAIALLLAAATACAAWAITLYKGGRFASGGSGWVGAWCVVSNPFWYVLAFEVMVILR